MAKMTLPNYLLIPVGECLWQVHKINSNGGWVGIVRQRCGSEYADRFAYSKAINLARRLREKLRGRGKNDRFLDVKIDRRLLD